MVDRLGGLGTISSMEQILVIKDASFLKLGLGLSLDADWTCRWTAMLVDGWQLILSLPGNPAYRWMATELVVGRQCLSLDGNWSCRWMAIHPGPRKLAFLFSVVGKKCNTIITITILNLAFLHLTCRSHTPETHETHMRHAWDTHETHMRHTWATVNLHDLCRGGKSSFLIINIHIYSFFSTRADL